MNEIPRELEGDRVGGTGPAGRELLILVCWAALLGFFYELLLGEGQALQLDNGAHNLPLTSETFRQWSRGEFPVWNPWLWSGSPLLSDPQAQVFYPPQMFAFAVAGESVWLVPRLVGAFHVAAGALGMSLLARSLGANLQGAMIAGLGFGSAPYFIRYTLAFENMAATVSWLPWTCLCLTQVLIRRSWIPAMAFGAFFSTLAWFAGHPQTFVQSAIVVGLFGMVAPCRYPSRRFWAAPLLVLVGLLLASYQVLPFLWLLSESQRFGGSAMLPYEFASFHLANLIHVALPRSVEGVSLGSAAIQVHFGAVAFFLCVVALTRPDRLRVGLALIAVLGFLLINSSEVRLSQLLAQLPIFSMLRGIPRWLLLCGFAMPLLAGLGIGDLRERPLWWMRSAVFAWVVALLLLGRLDGVSLDDPPFLIAIVGALLGLVAVWLPQPRARCYQLLTIVCLSTALLSSTALLRDNGEPTQGQSRFRTLMAASDLDFDEFADGRTLFVMEVDARRGNIDAALDLGMALGSFYQVPMASGYSGLLDDSYSKAVGVEAGGTPSAFRLQQMFGNLDAIVDILGVRRLITGRRQLWRWYDESNVFGEGMEIGGAWIRVGLEAKSYGTEAVLIENPRFLEGVRSVNRMVSVPDRESAIQATRRLGGYAKNTAVLEGASQGKEAVTSCQVLNVESRPGLFSLDAMCPRGDGFLVLSERWDEGWRARVNGVPVPVQRVYGLILGVPLERGTQSVEVRYVPVGFWPGVSIALGTLLVIVMGLLCSLRWRRRAASFD